MMTQDFPELFVEDGTDRYYIRGRLRESPSRFRSRDEGITLARIGGRLGQWWDSVPGRWEVLVDMGYRLRVEPPTAVGIPLSVIGETTAADNPDDCWWIRGRPELAVEVPPPDEPIGRMHERVKEYLACGVPLVWVVNTSDRTVLVLRPGVSPTAFNTGDTITGSPELPGFSCPVADFFR